MNKEQVEGKFEQIKGEIKKTWGKLTDNDVTLYNGKQEEFFGILKEKYGLTKEVAEKRIKELEDACPACSSTTKPTKVA